MAFSMEQEWIVYDTAKAPHRHSVGFLVGFLGMWK